MQGRRPARRAPRFSRRIFVPVTKYRRRRMPALPRPPRQKPMRAAKGAPVVIKADGLAAGKGVTVAASIEEAETAIERLFSGEFGAAGQTILVEDFLDGEEVSFFALCDGARAMEFASAKDHKRVGEGERGPNTGGMGAYSRRPSWCADTRCVMRTIVAPTLKGMAALGTPFKGVLFAGLMICADGPRLIEYNVRFGDPETQAMLPRLEEDLLALLLACVEERLPEHPARLSAKTALSVVLAAKGYPGAPVRGGKSLASSVPGR